MATPTDITQPDRAAYPPSGMPYTLLGANRRPYASAVPGQLGGHRKAEIYGRLDCRTARRAIAAGGYVRHRVFFADEHTAMQAGYRPCAVCMADAYQVWKLAARTKAHPPRFAHTPTDVTAFAPGRTAPTKCAEGRWVLGRSRPADPCSADPIAQP